jgi:hypothetical protein
MKKVNQTNQSKLQFRKQAIANLSKPEMNNVQGGQAAVTTSFGNCTGFLCCNKTQSIEIATDIITDLLKDQIIKP